MQSNTRTPLQELNLTDRFLFAETMDEPEAYQATVGILLEDEIEFLDRTQTEKELRVSPNLRAVRLDVVNMDDEGKIYFTEMQKTDTGNLLKRSRYYQAQLDVSLLEPGSTNFNLLNDSCLILVAPFDLFGFGLYRYTFTGQCREVPGLTLEDGATRIFINTYGTNKKDFSQEFLDFMEYINDTRPEVAKKSASTRVRLIHNTVERIRRSEKWGVKYMQRWEEIAYERQDAYGVGHNEALIELICRKLQKGVTAEEIADFLEEDVRLIRMIYDAAEKYAPEYDTEAIYREIKPLLPCAGDRCKH